MRQRFYVSWVISLFLFVWGSVCLFCDDGIGPVLAGQPVQSSRAETVAPTKAGYVPAPQPADTGRHQIGAVMCPLWKGGKMWESVAKYPAREPILSWYDEGQPEVTDWEIKWALDHGISFFLVCWYRAQGNFGESTVRPGLEHWIHDGLFHSRYGSQFRFAINWENANEHFCGRTSEKDFLTQLVPFWIDNYFRKTNYLLLDGKPVFSLHAPEKFVLELGGEAQAAAVLSQMRVACQKAGFKGIHILGQYCWGSPPELEKQAGQIKRLGMDASWSYHWPTFTGAFGESLRPTGSQAIEAQARLWATQAQPNLLTLSMGWDSEPWGFSCTKAQWQLTPAEFKILCLRAKTVMDRRTSPGLESRLVLLDNWNEYAEGHYIFPTQKDGFGYLEAIREVFATNAPAHADPRPETIGRGPYDAGFRAWMQRTNQTPRP